MYKIPLLVGIGGFIGTIFRYLLTNFIQLKYITAFPLGTFIVNIIGSLIIGLVFGLCDRFSIAQGLRLFLAAGICGGFTTFSAFSDESFILLKNGQFGYASLYISASVLLGLLAVFIGYMLIEVF